MPPEGKEIIMERLDFVSASCGGERCSLCGSDAAAKIEETIFHDDPQPIRHPLTAYVCADHFKKIMDRSGYLRADLVPDARREVDAKSIMRDALLHFKDRIKMDRRAYRDQPTKHGRETGAFICEIIGWIKTSGHLHAKADTQASSAANGLTASVSERLISKDIPGQRTEIEGDEAEPDGPPGFNYIIDHRACLAEREQMAAAVLDLAKGLQEYFDIASAHTREIACLELGRWHDLLNKLKKETK